MTLTIDKNNDKISNTTFFWDDEKMVYKLSFDYTFDSNSGLTLHYEMTIHNVSLWHDPIDDEHLWLTWDGLGVYETYLFVEEDDSELDMLDDEDLDDYYADLYDDFAENIMEEFLEDGVPDDIIFNIVDEYGYDSSIPNHEVGFFKKMVAKIRGAYRKQDVVRTIVTSTEQSCLD